EFLEPQDAEILQEAQESDSSQVDLSDTQELDELQDLKEDIGQQAVNEEGSKKTQQTGVLELKSDSKKNTPVVQDGDMTIDPEIVIDDSIKILNAEDQ